MKTTLLIPIFYLLTSISCISDDKVIRDANGAIVARVDKTATGTVTRDANGKIIGRSNFEGDRAKRQSDREYIKNRAAGEAAGERINRIRQEQPLNEYEARRAREQAAKQALELQSQPK